jgi:uncharacterized protein (PEP-CTERM system associated)
MTTTRAEAARSARLARPSASGFALLTFVSVSHAAAAPATVSPMPLQPTLSIAAVATDNAKLATAGNEREDLIGRADAGVIVRSVGPRVTITGDVGLEFIGYARHSEPAAVLPRGHLDLGAILLERALFFDGELDAERTRSDPLAAQSDSFSTANTVSTTRLRASPYYSHEFSDTLSALARSDTTITRNKSLDSTSVATPQGSTYRNDVVDIVRKPTPFGFSIDGRHEDTRYQDHTAAALKADTLQATLTAELDSELQLGLIGGHEHAVHDNTVDDDTTYGGVLQWRPSRHLSLDVAAQHHYFGNGWNAHLRELMPRTLVDLAMIRTVSASVAAFGSYSVDSDPTALLGAILSSRAPDASQGDQAAEELTQAVNLPTSFSQPSSVTADRAQLVTRAQLNLIHHGPRDTLYVSGWYQKATALASAAVLAPTPSDLDSRQWGGSLGLYHRLTPTLSAAAEVQWSTTDALGSRAGDHQRQASGTLSMTQRLGPHTTLSGGARHFAAHTALASTATTTQVRENQAFVGLRMQY